MKRRCSQTEPSFPSGRNTRININGGTFNNIQRDNYQLNNPHFDHSQFNIVQNRGESGELCFIQEHLYLIQAFIPNPGLDALRQSIITGAMHDSAELQLSVIHLESAIQGLGVEAGCWVALAATPSAIGSCGVRLAQPITY